MLTVKMYLHSDKDSNWSKGAELGLTGEALNMFLHACCEVEVDVIVDEDTGEATIDKVDGYKLMRC